MTSGPPKIIGYWLLVGAFLVVSMVILGGYTRLSQSGLSMVTWKPITGTIPPLNNTQWEEKFEQYKTSPEYIKRNYNFTIEEFKTIFWPEYLHRLLGRFLGIAFIIPFLIFLFKGWIKDKSLLRDLIIIFLLGGLQGFVGWFMVKSGLRDVPHVSHYRLALHLVTALISFGYILWVALKVFYPTSEITSSNINTIRKFLFFLLAITALQIIYGAFVAGLKAGYMYNTFPKMGGEWFPETINDDIKTKGIMSFFESHYLVQFIHRWLAVVVAGLVIWIVVKSRKLTLTNIQGKIILLLLVTVCIQFALGVFTLIFAVPISLGVIHQLVAVAFLAIIIISIFFFRNNRLSQQIK